MKDVRLVLVGVFIDFSAGESGKSFVFVQKINNVTEDSFIFSLLLVEWFSGSSDSSNCSSSLLQVADVEENSCVFQWFLFSLVDGDDNLVNLNWVSENWLNDFFNFFFQTFIVKEFFFSLFNFVISKTSGLHSEDHLGKVFSYDSFCDSDFISEDDWSVKLFLSNRSIVFTSEVNEGETFVFIKFSCWQLNSMNCLNSWEVSFQHGCCDSLFKSANVNWSGELSLFFLLFWENAERTDHCNWRSHAHHHWWHLWGDLNSWERSTDIWSDLRRNLGIHVLSFCFFFVEQKYIIDPA